MHFGALYLWLLPISFVALWLRHVYLVHVKFNRYMREHWGLQWKRMKEDTTLYRLSWMNLYFTKAAYDFIWRSDETYGDENIASQRKVMRRFIWELPLYFLAAVGSTIVLVVLGLLR
jgi:hypothetical protein